MRNRDPRELDNRDGWSRDDRDRDVGSYGRQYPADYDRPHDSGRFTGRDSVPPHQSYAGSGGFGQTGSHPARGPREGGFGDGWSRGDDRGQHGWGEMQGGRHPGDGPSGRWGGQSDAGWNAPHGEQGGQPRSYGGSGGGMREGWSGGGRHAQSGPGNRMIEGPAGGWGGYRGHGGEFGPTSYGRQVGGDSGGFSGGERPMMSRSGSDGWSSGDMPGGGRMEPQGGRGPKNYKRSDERIREDICDRLWEHSQADSREVNVQVKDGEVTLTGTIRERSHKHMIEQVAEQVRGVREVHNQIRMETSGNETRTTEGGGASQGTAASSASSSPAAQRRAPS